MMKLHTRRLLPSITTMLLATPPTPPPARAFVPHQRQHRRTVCLHGTPRHSWAGGSSSGSNANNNVGDDHHRPADPTSPLLLERSGGAVDGLIEWLQSSDDKNEKTKKKHVLVLTGAGLSTESGIPDYRGHRGSYHAGHKPVLHQEFVQSEYQRQRYWGRGLVGWRYFDDRQPAAGHVALAELERLGVVGNVPLPLGDQSKPREEGSDGKQQHLLSVITQNVDTLHRKAGTRHLLELHGRADVVECMQCGHVRTRHEFHGELEIRNAAWLQEVVVDGATTSDLRPDGDAALSTDRYYQLHVPACRRCSTGFYKPQVVFFGDSVPADRVRMCEAAVRACDGLLVVGSSLAVHSAFRHVRAAHQRGTPIAILNVGPTRAEQEDMDVLKLEAPAGPTLQGVAHFFQKQTER
jgi:NAD+-dependent protein deacetylase sirtuin 4